MTVAKFHDILLLFRIGVLHAGATEDGFLKNWIASGFPLRQRKHLCAKTRANLLCVT